MFSDLQLLEVVRGEESLMKAAFALTAVAGLTASVHAGFGPFGGGAIPDAITSHVTPGVLTLTGVVSGGGTVNNIAVTTDLTHTWVGDISMTITSPMGTTVDLVFRAGQTGATSFGDSSDFGGAYTWADGGAGFWAAAAAAGSTVAVPPGTYAASGNLNAASSLAALNGESADGVWTLVVRDWGGGDTGSVNSWSITPAPGAAALFGLAGLAGIRRRRA